MSKGSTARPLSIPREQFGERHTAIFGERKRVRWVPPGEDGENVGAPVEDDEKGKDGQ